MSKNFAKQIILINTKIEDQKRTCKNGKTNY